MKWFSRAIGTDRGDEARRVVDNDLGVVTSRGWALRGKLLVQRFWQPTSACLTCMPGNLANVISPAHWEIALRTGLLTGALVLLVSFTRFASIFHNRYRNAIAVGVLTALGDAYSHPDHYGNGSVEPLVTGVVSGLVALIGSVLLEERGRRVRAAWRWLAKR